MYTIDGTHETPYTVNGEPRFPSFREALKAGCQWARRTGNLFRVYNREGEALTRLLSWDDTDPVAVLATA